MKKKIEKINTTIIISAALLLVVFFLASIGAKTNRDELTLILDYGNENKQTFLVPAAEQKRAWNLLQQATVISGIDLQADKNFIPVKIDGFSNSRDGKNWVLYVDGVRKDVSPYEVFVEAPNRIVFRFE